LIGTGLLTNASGSSIGHALPAKRNGFPCIAVVEQVGLAWNDLPGMLYQSDIEDNSAWKPRFGRASGSPSPGMINKQAGGRLPAVRVTHQ
ncbi:MAG TPA: hypothetical protein VLE22_09715, partial [Bryobacteraceae bacterium]|nr:hypothetical protein [Bryobacteraceae bacterium]